MLHVAPALLSLFVLPLSMHIEGFQQRWFKVKYNTELSATRVLVFYNRLTMNDVAILYNSVFTHAHYIE